MDQEIEYFIYARKSSESEDRQVQSIDDQLTQLDKLANTERLRVRAVFTESQSAKTPEIRPVFRDMLRRIEAGEAQGILCREISRLARNPVDSGRISWLLQRGVIQRIRTTEREYRPDDNVLLWSVESGMANQYILDLSRHVRGAIREKLGRGEWSSMAPLGYLNDPASRKVVPDPARFLLLRRAWELMLRGDKSVPEVRRHLNDWGFRTRTHKRGGGLPMLHNTLYKVFSNPFYLGIMRVAGKEYPRRP